MKDQKYSFASWIIGIPIFGYLGYIFNYMADGFFRAESDVITVGTQIFMKRFDLVVDHPLNFKDYYNGRSIVMAVIFILVFLFLNLLIYLSKKTTMEGMEYGTARWGNPKRMSKCLADKNKDSNILLSQNFSLAIDMKKSGLNRNVLVIGGSGAGKTFKFVGPNAMQANMSIVDTDPKGDTIKDYGGVLLREGFIIKVLDLIEPDKSDGYNPFQYICNQQDVVKLISNIMDNTTPPNNQSRESFWDKAESLFYQAIFFYVLYEAENQNLPKNFRTFLMLVNEAKVMADEDDLSPMDMRFGNLPEGHEAKKVYNKFMSGAEDTLRSIIISAHARLFPFESEGILRIFEKDEMDLYALGEGALKDGVRDNQTKTALFIKIPDDDKSFNFVPGMLYTQMFQVLYASARKYGNVLPIPVQCYFDEFKNISMPSNFLDILATCRSRNIGVVPIFQDKSQIQALYKESVGTMISNCDTLLFLGGTDPDVKKFISESLGDQTIWKKNQSISRGRSGSTSQTEDKMGRKLMTPDEVGRMNNQDCLVMVRGEYPIKDKKLNAKQHKRAKYSGLKGFPYIHKKHAEIHLKRMDEIGDNDVILTPELILELLQSQKEMIPSNEWVQAAEKFSDERQEELKKEKEQEWQKKLPEHFERLSLVEILACTDFSVFYTDQIVAAIESGITEKEVKQFIKQGLSEEEIEKQIKIHRIIKAEM